jgi:hypothetical protein
VVVYKLGIEKSRLRSSRAVRSLPGEGDLTSPTASAAGPIAVDTTMVVSLLEALDGHSD